MSRARFNLAMYYFKNIPGGLFKLNSTSPGGIARPLSKFLGEWNLNTLVLNPLQENNIITAVEFTSCMNQWLRKSLATDD